LHDEDAAPAASDVPDAQAAVEKELGDPLAGSKPLDPQPNVTAPTEENPQIAEDTPPNDPPAAVPTPPSPPKPVPVGPPMQLQPRFNDTSTPTVARHGSAERQLWRADVDHGRNQHDRHTAGGALNVRRSHLDDRRKQLLCYLFDAQHRKLTRLLSRSLTQL
jgi:hypothetical protein